MDLESFKYTFGEELENDNDNAGVSIDNGESRNDEENDNGFGKDIGDGYGEDTIDPLEVQERAEAGEDDKEQFLGKETGENNYTGAGQRVFRRVAGSINKLRTFKMPMKTLAVLIAKKHPFSMSKHVEARCIFCHKESIVRCKKPYIYISAVAIRLLAHTQVKGFYCVNPRCKMSFQRDYIQMAAGNVYQGKVIPVREIFKVSKT